MASIVRNSRQIIWNHALISIVIQAIELKDVFRNSIISLPNRSYYSRSSNALGGLSMSTSSHTMVVDHKPRWRSKSPIGVFPITIFWIAFLITTCDMPITATTDFDDVNSKVRNDEIRVKGLLPENIRQNAESQEQRLTRLSDRLLFSRCFDVSFPVKVLWLIFHQFGP